MTETTCVRCGRPMADQAYACTACANRTEGNLADIADMAPAARDIAHGLARRGTGGSSGKPGSSLPFDLGATARLDAVEAALLKHARRIAETRGVPLP